MVSCELQVMLHYCSRGHSNWGHMWRVAMCLCLRILWGWQRHLPQERYGVKRVKG